MAVSAGSIIFSVDFRNASAVIDTPCLVADGQEAEGDGGEEAGSFTLSSTCLIYNRAHHVFLIRHACAFNDGNHLDVL